MATIAEQLTSLANTKIAIKDAIVAKGVQVADDTPFRNYADKIGEISGGGEPSDEWQPNPNWWDIRKILDEDTRDYAGKVGVILYNFNDVSDFQLSSSGMTAVATSDGAFYSYADNGNKVSHNWGTTQDKDDGRGLKTRWVIYYYTTDTTSDTFQQSVLKFGWAYNYIAYLVLRINCSNGSGFCQNQRLLEAIDNFGYTISVTNFSYFCSNCYSLTRLPDGLDTSSGTNFSNFCSSCYSLQKLPDGLDTSNGTNFSGFCQYCCSLTRLPDGLDTSSGTNFSSFCSSCNSLTRLPDGLDTSSGTNFSSFCQYCYSLQKLPDGLDTSNGTNFSGFCNGCYSLNKLLDGLDTSNGTNFSNFCSNCNSLQKLPEITMSANTTNYTSKYSAPFNNLSWIKELPLTLPSNTNFWLDSSTLISIESFRYIADHAPDVTATPRTLTVGSTNITRINAADPTIITDLNAKGWNIQ
jgi:hypothetical protein